MVANEAYSIVPPSPTSSQFSTASCDTAFELEDPEAYSVGSKEGGLYLEVAHAGLVGTTRRRTRYGLGMITSGFILGGAFALALQSYISSQGKGDMTKQSDDVFALPKFTPAKCDPYYQRGILLVNTSYPAGNVWSPLSSSPNTCQPIDYLARLRAGRSLDFAHNKLIVLFGDSIDRGHNEDFCELVGGVPEQIRSDHNWSPPYPKGQELTPKGYWNEALKQGPHKPWENVNQSRPLLCYLKSHNLAVLSVFHFGYRPTSKYIREYHHFYPPATIEERFDEIVLPLIASISAHYSLPSSPSIISLTPGFWDLYRLSHEEQTAFDSAKNISIALHGGNGSLSTSPDGENKWDPFRSMSKEQREWFSGRYTSFLGHVLSRATGSQILWRALHHTKTIDMIPFNRVQTLNMLSLNVVEKIAEESRARLQIDEWGFLILGHEAHFKDSIHPKMLPAGYLYGNMLLEKLRRVDQEDRAIAQSSTLAVPKQ